jgi:hypothetical protein
MLLFALLLSLTLSYSASASAVGQQLTSPEQGWKRYDDINPGITYSSGWRMEYSTDHYNGTHYYPTGGISSWIKFTFKGTSLRIGSYSHEATRISEVKIKIDGIIETYNPKFGSYSPQMIVYEKTGLNDIEHSVEIWNEELGKPLIGYGLDFIDINDSGYLATIADAPSSLIATGQDKNVQLTWHGIPDATGYNIERSLAPGGPYTLLASNVTDTTYADSNVSNGIIYYYVVKAVNASGQSANSNEASAIPQIPAPSAPTNLTAATSNAQVFLLWNHVPEATGYTVSRSTYSGGPYTTVTSVTYNTYMNIGLSNGMTYYYVVQAFNAGGTSGYSNEAAAALPMPRSVMDIDIAENRVRVGQEFTSNIILKDVAGIYAEDFTIQYNDALFEFRGFEEIPGYKVYHAINHSNGTLRFIVASQGAEFGINSDTIFLKLKFRAKAVGIGKVDATSARIADTTAEYDLDAANCLEDTVVVESQDVNMSGEYTLLDLAIDAAHFGELGSTVDPTKYAANQVGDDTIRDEDLLFIVSRMLSNTNYTPNYN